MMRALEILFAMAQLAFVLGFYLLVKPPERKSKKRDNRN